MLSRNSQDLSEGSLSYLSAIRRSQAINAGGRPPAGLPSTKLRCVVTREGMR